MKKRAVIIGAGIALFAVFQIAGGLIASSGFFTDGRFGCDLRLRRNEIRCAHQGVNSFRIWTRETTLSGFTPITRPDMENLPRAPGDAVVHAYPPWHTAMFYFYGWLPEQMCLSLMSVVFGLCLFFIVSECVRISKAHFEHYGLAVGLSLAVISYFIAQCFVFLNYGVLVLAAFLLMNRALEKGHDVAAGLCWAVMMVKPQVGLLFVWPLFWHRHYRTIVTATVACLAGTFFTSLQVHESMIDLILQIPQIGKPYGAGGLVDRVLGLAIGKSYPFVGMLFFFLLMGLLTWALRRNRDFIVSCVPVVVVVPLWTYGQEHDYVIFVIALLVLAERMFAARKFDRWVALGGVYFLSILFIHLWRMAVHFHAFDPAGFSKIYSLVELLSQMALVAVAVLLIREEWLRRHRGTVELRSSPLSF